MVRDRYWIRSVLQVYRIPTKHDTDHQHEFLTIFLVLSQLDIPILISSINECICNTKYIISNKKELKTDQER